MALRIGLAPDWHGLALDWLRIGSRLAQDRLPRVVSGLASDCLRIGSEVAPDWLPIGIQSANDLLRIGIRLAEDWQQIG